MTEDDDDLPGHTAPWQGEGSRLPPEPQHDDGILALEIAAERASLDEHPPATLHQRVRRALDEVPTPLGLEDLRATCRVRKATLCAALADLTRQRLIVRTAGGYALPPSPR